ncbi:MAG: hypothetical protein KDC83_06675 [Flavobacteriales bacterium]|nr:hypothetical protein [Flavobacteriales bacterium]
MFKSSLNLIIGLSLASMLLLACKKKLFVEDISDRSIQLMSPGNNVRLENQTVTFIWSTIEEAENYQFQLATPSFGALKLLLFDMDTAKSTITLNLSPGEYEWKVRAKNSRYFTPYSVFKLTVDSGINLTGSQVVLTSPVDSLFTNVTVTRFEWEKLIQAEEYIFKIVKGTDLENGELFTSEVSTKESNFTLTKPLENGFYLWGVKAENKNSKSGFSQRFIWFDDEAPSVPVTSIPAENQVISGGKLTYQWDKYSDAGSATFDSLYLYGDNQLQNLLKVVRTSQSSYGDSLAAGAYYWRVSRADRAGNLSGPSTIRSFTIQ